MEQIRETAGVTLRAILRYVRARGGDTAVTHVLNLAGEHEPPEAYDDARRWWSYETKINVFAAAAQALGDESVGLRVGQSILSYTVNTPLRLGLLLLGSPTQLIRLIATTSAKFNSAADMSTLSTGHGTAAVQYRLRNGYQPSRYDCDYTRGLLTQLPALFGLPAATVTHDVCQVRGAEACVYTVRWRQRRLFSWLWRGRQREDAADDILAGRMELLQRTVAELVAAEQPERALALVADRAGYAVNAQAFLLVASPAPDQPRQAHGYGLTDAEIAVLTDAPPTSFAGTLVADIASPNRYYGYLVAYCEDFFDAERRMLDAYANLAAVALDALSALETAAERQRTAESLLALARQLTLARTSTEVAEVTAGAVKSVMGADSASVLLHQRGKLRLVANAGAGAGRLRKAQNLTVSPQDTTLFDRFRDGSGQPRVYDGTSEEPFIRAMLDTFGHDTMIIVDIALPDHPYGILVAAYDTPQATGRAREIVNRMAGVADQAATVLRTCELLDETWRLAHVDALTGLANRRAFMSALDTALGAGEGAVLFIDLDGFKSVNDTLGHAAGDELLTAVAGRLGACVRTGDLVARLGGDEFVVLTHGTLGTSGVPELAERIRAAFTEPIAVRGTSSVAARASVGGTRFHLGEEPQHVLHRADIAMYEAKRLLTTVYS
ncbi:diguanylate cyclase domain-containing protein [Dactylosporangium sp. NPDC000521]|uniref:diguanylate cyclase domain-containing protein n=1 Tax=Dactylosporangium sp. NPDC000521 TaxID=3363975 RepID=UPI00368F125E